MKGFLIMFDPGQVMAFRLRPHWGVLGWAGVIFVLGSIITALLWGEYRDGRIAAREEACLVAGITLLLVGVMVIGATSRLWFRSLYNKRHR